ncbi:zinc finger SWIM domain protein [Kribbella flavida DSM 17836]|uniref:Zinc finger SWIM domain protein n=1 Tax=Kribbella flavida (strain DSM 17836 / JCM 10339 / NBRC 14399) TaxID=479435 RepID=D2PMX2_KRIFD|nr:SWIM zinc finger family protein [Kribbella flavida]ADB32674.1 zinc finger SWIM domain protein [Kribbella flavida DSM 17836]
MSDARGFAPFPAQRGRSTRGRSWWAQAWVQAMEDTSLDSDQLRKGRRFANSGQVGTITVSPGRIAASVEAPEDRYEAVVLVDRLSDDEWTRFLDQVGARAGHIAALLDGDMPHDLVTAAEDAGVPLLPGIGDLDPSCSCDAWELPCQHAAGLCYQVAWLLDDDPFILLLMRGRSREDLLDDLQRRTTQMTAQDVSAEGATTEGAAAGGATADAAGALSAAGELAAEVFVAPVASLPEPPEVPSRIGIDELVVSGTTPLSEVSLPLLALDAARRARAELGALLSGAPVPWALDEWHDAVRLAAEYPELRPRLVDATGRAEELGVGVQAWRYGGAPGLDVLEHPWIPEGGELVRARAELQAAADEPLELEISGNQLTAAAVRRQLRLDRVGRWHPYHLVGDRWLPAGPADRDPTVAFATEPALETTSRDANGS